MKKIALGTLVIAFALTLSACGEKAQEKKPAGEMMKEKSSGVISSIKDAMGMGKKMKCTYKMKNAGGEFEAVTYIEGEKYKSETAAMGMKMAAVYDGEDMYTWQEGQKTGMKMTKACQEEMEAMDTGEEMEEQEEMKVGVEAFDGAMNVDCEAASSIDFSVPSDIEFTDQCAMMKQMQGQAVDMQKQAEEMMKNMPDMPNMPQ